MTPKKFLPNALFIGILAMTCQIVDQLIVQNGGGIGPLVGGGGWIAFQAWAMYFLAGGTLKGGLRALIGYGFGMVASIAILFCGTQLSGPLGFWSVPLVLLVLVPPVIYLMIGPELVNLVPAVFVGAGVFFGVMTYCPFDEGLNQWGMFGQTFLAETVYCILGLIFGWLTVTQQTWYNAKFVEPAVQAEVTPAE
ncbi:MAG: DUF1097 domain-containing protein [Bifidobacteriaceae bacterium]|jgi:hypothetical protein|nr:DUF1097 domain-containing protein [Bifidobacteriaceae bacterium]